MVTVPPRVGCVEATRFAAEVDVVVVGAGMVVEVVVGSDVVEVAATGAVVAEERATVVDVVVEPEDRGLVVLVDDVPSDVGTFGALVSGSDRSSGAGSTTTTVGPAASVSIGTSVVGITVDGWITRSLTWDTAAHDRVRAAITARPHRPANFIQLGTCSLLPRADPGLVQGWLEKPQVTVDDA